MREASHAIGTESAESQGSLFEDTDRRDNIFGTEGTATDYFIAPSYRRGQREAIEAVESAFEAGYRYVLLDAPTGSGKSHIARAFAFQSGSAHIITVMKILQDQYERDFSDMFIMKGRSAYMCCEDIGVTCAEGPCRRRSKNIPKCGDCPYTLAKKAALKAAVTVHNFDSFYYQNLHGGYDGRELLVIDEAHNIESKYSEFMSFTLSSKMGYDIPQFEKLRDYDSFIVDTYEDVEERIAILEQAQEKRDLDKVEVKKLDDLNNLARRLYRYIANRKSDAPTEYVFDYKSTAKENRVQFRPVKIGDFAVNSLFKYGKRVLFMSATIIDKRLFCDSVGIDPDEAAYIGVPSHFPAENRPIIKRYVGPMNYKEIDKTLPKLVDEIERILDKYPSKKGIIQTHSEKIAQYIKDTCWSSRLTFNKDYATPLDMLEAHKNKRGSFIVASGLREGLDLRGDLSKVQVFCKIPYPSLGDKRVKRRMELDDEWYGYMTALMFVQSLGRSVRSEKERAVTFILDEGFGFFYHRNKKFIPGYIKEAIKW